MSSRKFEGRVFVSFEWYAVCQQPVLTSSASKSSFERWAMLLHFYGKVCHECSCQWAPSEGVRLTRKGPMNTRKPYMVVSFARHAVCRQLVLLSNAMRSSCGNETSHVYIGGVRLTIRFGFSLSCTSRSRWFWSTSPRAIMISWEEIKIKKCFF